MYVSIIFAAESQSPRASFSLHALPELEQTDWKQYTQGWLITLSWTSSKPSIKVYLWLYFEYKWYISNSPIGYIYYI